MGVCLLIHGFTGTPHELGSLTDTLKARGHQVVTPVLAGHGGSRQDMDRVSWLDWIHSVETVLASLLKEHQRIHLVGFSMGGLIAAYLTTKYQEHILSLTMLAAPIYMINPKQMFKTIAEAIQKAMRTQGRHEDVARYLGKMKSTPIRSLAHFRRLVQTVRPLLAKIEVPVLVMQGEIDDLVEARSATYIYDHVRSAEKHLHLFPKSGHMICLDCEADEVCRLGIEFIEKHEH